MPTERFQFPGAEGQQLAAALELPEGKTLEDVVVGMWPGDETDEEIFAALERLS